MPLPERAQLCRAQPTLGGAHEHVTQLVTETPQRTRITNSELQRLYPDVHPETIRRDLSDLVTKDVLVKMGAKRGSYYVLKSAETPKP